MTRTTAPSVSDAIAKAIDEINRLCAGRGRMTRDGLVGRDWTMCIPHQDDDSDHVFAELVIACKRLQAENRDLLESQLAARREADAAQQRLSEIATLCNQEQGKQQEPEKKVTGWLRGGAFDGLPVHEYKYPILDRIAALAATPDDARAILTCRHCGFNAGDRTIFEAHWQTNHAAAAPERDTREPR